MCIRDRFTLPYSSQCERAWARVLSRYYDRSSMRVIGLVVESRSWTLPCSQIVLAVPHSPHMESTCNSRPQPRSRCRTHVSPFRDTLAVLQSQSAVLQITSRPSYRCDNTKPTQSSGNYKQRSLDTALGHLVLPRHCQPPLLARSSYLRHTTIRASPRLSQQYKFFSRPTSPW